MSNNFKENSAGGINFSAPVFSFGTTTPAVNSGFSFDLPMASIQSMANNALSFTSNNASANRGFLSNVISNSNTGVKSVANQSMAFQRDGLATIRTNTNRLASMLSNIAFMKKVRG